MGVLYAVEDDCYEDLLQREVDDAIESAQRPGLADLFDGGDTYTIER